MTDPQVSGLETDERAWAELATEREQETEAALLYVLHLIEATPRPRGWQHLAVLCRECGISYDAILARLGH
jgi:hypothetical protein